MVMGSPAITSPPTSTTTMTPVLRTNWPSVVRSRTALVRPGLKLSSWAHGFRKPVTTTTASAYVQFRSLRQCQQVDAAGGDVLTDATGHDEMAL